MKYKVYTLVITDSAYMDVRVFSGDKPPDVDAMLKSIDFADSPELRTILGQMNEKLVTAIVDDYVAMHYNDAGKDYLFHLKCHSVEV